MAPPQPLSYTAAASAFVYMLGYGESSSSLSSLRGYVGQHGRQLLIMLFSAGDKTPFSGPGILQCFIQNRIWQAGWEWILN